MKKIILYIGSVVFAALMVYNIGSDNLIAKNIDVSLESIMIMAAADDSESQACNGDINFLPNAKLTASPVYDTVVETECGFKGWIAKMPLGSVIRINYGQGLVAESKNCTFWLGGCCDQRLVGIFPL